MELPPHPSLDSVTTIREDGSRRFLHPSDVRGRFTLARRISALLLIAFYVSLPWIRIGGYPAVFLDVAERRFHLFGLAFAFQDLWLLFFLITGLGFSLFFVTALLGRVWCGWACPQTVFLDHVYRRIERWLEGDAVARRALDAAPMTARKAARRAGKHLLYIAVSAVIAHLLLAYFVSIPQVWSMIRAAPRENWSAFAFIAAFTAALYFNFAWFREQLCIVICPYGRLQSALTDDNTLIVGYDGRRGEPRRALGDVRREGGAAGDCVACNRCVQVCPTGIDIRDGLQMECIGCAACIDACDQVMGRIHRPRGLIRYDSMAGFLGAPTRWVRPRTALYAVLLLAGASAAGWGVSTLRPANFGITRLVGAPYFMDGGFVRNQFLVRIVNKRTEPARFVVDLGLHPAEMLQTGCSGPIEVPALGEVVEPVVLREPLSLFRGPFPLVVTLRDEAGRFALGQTVEFLGPDADATR